MNTAVDTNFFMNRKQRRRMAKMNKTQWTNMPKITKEENDYFITSMEKLDTTYKSIQEFKQNRYRNRRAQREVERLENQNT